MLALPAIVIALSFTASPLATPASSFAASRPAPAGHRACVPEMLAKKKAGGGKTADVQVVLSVPVKGLGKAGDLVKVKPAYAENFIVRQNMGAIATPEKLAEIAANEEAAAAAAAAEKQSAVEAEATLKTVFGEEGAVVEKRVGPDGAIFGSVTAAEVAELILERAGVTVDKRKITVPSIPKVGTADASIKLHPKVTATLKLVVVPAAQ